MRNISRLLMIVFALSGCTTTNRSGNEYDHDHDEVKLLITSYNENFEIFAEADPFIQGRTSQILVHVTSLEDFKPLTDGQVTLSLVIGDKGIRQSIESGQRPGIFSFMLRPETTGSGRIFFDIDHQGQTYRLEGGNIRVFDNEHDAIHAAEEMYPFHPAAITFTKEQSWVVDYATAAVEKRSLGLIIKTAGEILPAHGDEIILSAQGNGIIQFVTPALYEGTEVRQGEIMINVSGEGLAEGNTAQRYQQAQNNLENSRANYQRLASLAEERIVSQAELLQAKNEYDNARSVYESISRNFSQAGQQISSPINGFVTRIMVSPGQYVASGDPVMALARNNDLIIRTEVQQRHAHLLPGLQTANIISGTGETFTLEELGGRILSYARTANQTSHLLAVNLQISNNENWIPGSLVNVYLKTAHDTEQVVVPNSALLEEQGNFFVFVQIYPESFEKREVRIGNTDGIYTEIVRGLDADERIVSRGAIMVKMAAASGTLDPHSGHVH